ncbi:CNRG phosphodiesterase, partial [Polypterus senegalus]
MNANPPAGSALVANAPTEVSATPKRGPPKFKQRQTRQFKSKPPKKGVKGFGDDIPGMEGLGTGFSEKSSYPQLTFSPFNWSGGFLIPGFGSTPSRPRLGFSPTARMLTLGNPLPKPTDSRSLLSLVRPSVLLPAFPAPP